MSRKYYTLCERTPGRKFWFPEFGDFDKTVVEQERSDMMDSGSFIKGTRYKIIVTDGKTKSINDKIAVMNADEKLNERC